MRIHGLLLIGCMQLVACDASEPYQPLLINDCIAETALSTVDLRSVSAVERPVKYTNDTRLLTANGTLWIKLTPQDIERLAAAVRLCSSTPQKAQ